MPGGLKMPEKQCNRAVCLFPQQLHCVAAVIGRPCGPRNNGPTQGMVAGKRQAMGWWPAGGTAAGRMAYMALACGCTRAINGQGHHNRMALLNVGWQPGEALDCQLRLPQREASGRQGPPVGAETSPRHSNNEAHRINRPKPSSPNFDRLLAACSTVRTRSGCDFEKNLSA